MGVGADNLDSGVVCVCMVVGYFGLTSARTPSTSPIASVTNNASTKLVLKCQIRSQAKTPTMTSSHHFHLNQLIINSYAALSALRWRPSDQLLHIDRLDLKRYTLVATQDRRSYRLWLNRLREGLAKPF